MNTDKPTEHIMEQGKTLVRAIEALDTIEPTGPIEEVLVWILARVYKRRLRGIVGAVPAWVAEEILSASEGIGERRPVEWISRS